MFTPYDLKFLKTNLVPLNKWQPTPALNDRKWWNKILQEKQGETLILEGETLLNESYITLKATDYIRFRSGDGNRRVFEEVYFKRRNNLWTLTVAECLENKGRFLNQVTNLLWAILEETSWCLPAHNQNRRGLLPLPDRNEPIVDLFAAETAVMAAYVLHLLREPLDKITPQIYERGSIEIKTRVLMPFFERDDFGWMGFMKDSTVKVNNWVPWICSNILGTVFLQEEDNEIRALIVQKALRCLDNFINVYPADGGCDEGPAYWGRAGASLFDCLDFLFEATGGKLDLFDNDLIKNMGSYIYKVFIDRSSYVNFADAPAQANLPGELVMKYGERIGDEKMISLGLYAEKIRREVNKKQEIVSPYRWFRYYQSDFTGWETAKPPRLKSVLLPGLEVVTARTSDRGKEGYFLALKGGHNNESHNHNDVGQLIIYRNGQPLLIDAGVGDYSKNTFSSDRYKIWTMQSAYHNLPVINGCQQKEGEEFQSSSLDFSDDGNLLETTLDFARAYPEDAALESLVRNVLFDREADQITLTDSFTLKEFITDHSWSLLFASKPELKENRLLLNEGVTLVLPEDSIVTIEEIFINPNDKKMWDSWEHNLWRVIIKNNNSSLKRSMTFIFNGSY